MHVLIIEDDAAIREMIHEVLATAGASCWEASSCSRARNLLQEKSFDAVIMDNGLPDGQGLAMVREVRASCVRVIMATGDGHSREFREQALLLGAEAVFAKPFDVVELVRHVMGNWNA